MAPLLVIVCAGTRGDVQPYVALGKGLVKAGYRVRLVTHENFGDLVQAHGLEFAPVRVNPRDLMKEGRARAVLAAGGNPVRHMWRMFGLYRRLMPVFLQDCVQGCRGAQGILFSILGFPGYHIAEAMGIPAIAAFLQPQTRTRAFPAPTGYTPRWLRSLGVYNWLSYVFTELFGWNLARATVNRWRVEVLGLKPLSFVGPYPHLYRGQVPVLYGFSRHVVPRPPDWPSSVHVTGYWFLDTSRGWAPPRDLEEFLRTGDPPIYVGFGSMRPSDPLWTAQVVGDALHRVGARGIISKGWADLRPVEKSGDVFLVDDVPHDWLFPRVSAVVHHGGAGTTAAGLRAGRPTLVVPFIVDQFFWGDRVANLGAGPAPIPEKRLTVERLAQAMEQILHDTAMRECVEDLGERIRSEDGVAEAVRLIARYV